MKTFSLTSVKLQNSKFWLLGIAAGLVAIHLTLTWKAGTTDRLSTSILFWGAALFLLWKKGETLSLEAGVFSSFFGLLLIAMVLFNSSVGSGHGTFQQISPFISALGLALLASGVKGFKQYWQELIILLALAMPVSALSDLIEGLLNVSLLTAKMSTFALWHLGFEVVRQGVFVILPKGAIEVYPGCSGLKSTFELLRLAVLFLVLFPTTLSQKIWVPVVAVLLAFMINGIRIALMAVLVGSNQEAFEYWHEGGGSSIFSVISMLSFGLFCYFLTQQEEPENQDALES